MFVVTRENKQNVYIYENVKFIVIFCVQLNSRRSKSAPKQTPSWKECGLIQNEKPVLLTASIVLLCEPYRSARTVKVVQLLQKKLDWTIPP